jgi:gamma-glutamyl phosphate reductase
LTPQKITGLVEGTRILARSPDMLGKAHLSRHLSSSLSLRQISCPIGVLLVIFESRPDCLIQIASLAIRSGNGVLLKGGKEAHHTNAILHSIVVNALIEGGNVPAGAVGLLPRREQIAELLLSQHIDLVIPRGSNELVASIKSQTKIPVLGHSAGICHIYIDQFASQDVTRKNKQTKCSFFFKQKFERLRCAFVWMRRRRTLLLATLSKRFLFTKWFAFFFFFFFCK